MTKFLLLLLVSANLFGAISTDKKYKLNQYMGAVGSQVQLGTLIDEGGQKGLAKDGHQSVQLLVGTYDFTVQGGASATSLHLGVSLPSKAIITRSYIDTVTALAGTGATVAVSTGEAYENIKAQTAIASYADQIDGVSSGAASAFKKQTAERGVYVDVKNTALTAGKFKVYIQYVMSQ